MFTRLTVNTWMNCKEQQEQRLKVVGRLITWTKLVAQIYLS